MGEMVARGRLQGLVAGLVLTCASALPASAQITTGTVAGSVKDAQGGSCPARP